MIEKLIDFPMHRQTFDYDCGASALKAVLMYYGIDIREDRLMEALGTDSINGTNAAKITEVAVSQGFKVWSGELTLERLKKIIDKGIPVICLIQAWADDSDTVDWSTNDNGHYVVAVGYGGGKVFFEDPSSIEMTYMKEDEFIERWHDSNEERDGGQVYDQWGLMIYGKKPVYLENFVHME